jgi:hypothetical protein
VTRTSVHSNYPIDEPLVDWDPLSTVHHNDSSCGSVTLGASGQGLSLSLSKPLCPEKIDPVVFDGGATGSTMVLSGTAVFSPVCGSAWKVLCDINPFD